MRPFIIDCDTGTDDAIAIVAALRLKDIDIRAITSVNGNVAEKYTSQNNLDLLEYLGIDHIPVTHGAKRPFFKESRFADNTHGKTGLGTVILPHAERLQFDSQIASEKIYEVAKQYPGELEILAVGPLTNLGICLLQHPDLKQLVKHIWIMGGAVIGGNSSTSSEFNIWVDPEAAHLVFTSGIPLTMVGLDVTLKAEMLPSDSQRLRASAEKGAIFVADLLDFMFARHQKGGEGALMHDALALAAAFHPKCMTYGKFFGDVECRGAYTSGHTHIDVRNRSGKEANVEVALSLDVVSFREWLVEAILGKK